MYQVIARKYRPQNFSELLGQEHVQKTLSNAIESRRIAHGYIFAGQRGTGKTTVARILARCLNCVNGPTATPCGVCSSCIEITAGNATDVIEIDAASNRGINEMREIRENVRYRPSRDRYKVFIIDEAHQITKEAFNALLKTLEEPPEWVVFILCTTEANEIPNTIASRCQQFTFRSVDFQELVDRMKYIAAQEEIDTTDEALAVIAHAGEGSVRDSLSALDQAIACCGRTLRVEDIRALLGVFGADSLKAVADAVLAQDSGRMIEIVAELEATGRSLQHFCRELARYWRNLLVARIAGKQTRLIAASEQEQASFLQTAGGFSEEDLTRYLNLTLDLYKVLQYSLQPRLHLELGLVKLVHAGRLRSIEQALADLGPESADAGASAGLLTAKSTLGAPARSTFQASSKVVAQTVSAPPPPPQSDPVPIAKTGDLKEDLHGALRAAGLAFSADALQSAEVQLQGSELVIRAPKLMLMALRDAGVQKVATQLLGKPVRIRAEAGENMSANAPKPNAESAPGQADELRERALADPGVRRFQELFPNAQIRSVRNLNE